MPTRRRPLPAIGRPQLGSIPVPVDPPELPSNPGIADIRAALEQIADQFSIAADDAPVTPGAEIAAGLSRSLTIPDLVSGLVVIPVEATVRWSVTDGGGAGLAEDRDFSASPDVGAAAPLFTLRPQPVELTGALTGLPLAEQPADVRQLRARITLTALTSQVPALGLDDVTVELEPVLPVRVLKLPIPTILALFRHTGAHAVDPEPRLPGRRDGALLLLMPTLAPFVEGPLAGATTPLRTTLADLAGVLSVLGAALPGLTELVPFAARLTRLTEAIDAHLAVPTAAVVVALRDREDNLNEIRVIDRQSRLRNDIEANNEMSSLIMIARPDRVVQAFNRRRFEAGWGHLKLKTGLTMSVLIEDLHVEASAGQSLPGADPSESAVVRAAPLRTFGNAISSFEFADETPRRGRRPPGG